MLTRVCTMCGRRNTTMKTLKPQVQEQDKKCKYHWKVQWGLTSPQPTNPYNPVTHVPGA